MKKIGIMLVIIGILCFITFKFIDLRKEIYEEELIHNYIEDTSIKNIPINFEKEKWGKKEKRLHYIGLIEIQAINLKTGFIESTEDFKSINYSVSIDKNSQLPNQFGNLILYAHSGNSNIAYFKNLYKLKNGDMVNIFFNGIKYQYQIFDIYNVKKTGSINVVFPKINKYVTLITCNPQKKGLQVVLTGQIIKSEEY